MTKAELVKLLEPYPDDVKVCVRSLGDDLLWDVAEIEEDRLLDGHFTRVIAINGG